MARRDSPLFHGFLIIDKPPGLTSHDVVSRIRRRVNQRSVGHAGTLDPAATGVLPLALGDATKVLSAIEDSSKTYRAEITFGVETDTLDADGRVVSQRSASLLNGSDIEKIVKRYVGTIEQQVPRYSAIQVGGQRLYTMARAGVDFVPPVRQVTIHDIQVIDFQPPLLTICVDCGAGTYIRSLASDLGKDAGTGAYLSDLVRLRAGVFTIADAWTLDELTRIPMDEQWPFIAHHPDSAIPGAPAIILGQGDQLRWSKGQSVVATAGVTQTRVRAYSTDGNWLGYGEVENANGQNLIHPRRVISAELTLGGDQQHPRR